MSDPNVVLEFPSGRPFPQGRRRKKSVAELARRLAASARIGGSRSKACPLPIELHELAGVADDTVGILTALADMRFIAPSCAARLALRHADEIDGMATCRSGPSPDDASRHELLLAENETGRIAFSIKEGASRAWVACGPLSDLGLLRRVCPLDADSIYLMPMADKKGRPTCRIGMSRSWLTALRRHVRAADRVADRVVLIVGGLPMRGIRRTSIRDAIAEGIRRSGVRPVAGSRTSEDGTKPFATPCGDGTRYLLLIELAFPGLVERNGEAR